MIRYKIHPVDPQVRILEKAAHSLRHDNGICVYPTDTVYGMGACATNPKALDKICTIVEKDKAQLFSFICSDFSQMSRYVRIDNTHFKLLKRYLPGPYTFILPATSYVPKKVSPKRRTVGVRMPDNAVCLALVRMLGEPLANASINVESQFRGDPDRIAPAIMHEVDVMLDMGPLENPIGSTIVDLTNEDPVVVRMGKGEWREQDKGS
jgi:tRNA threonylcarbamoyl adenosine modification protein (Sua5/YciO/YrdC/YwlC family)